MVIRIAHIIAEKADRGETRERFEKLGLRNGRIAQGGRTRDLAEIGIGHFREQRCSQGQLLRRQLIDVGIGYAHVGDLGAGVPDLECQVRADLALNEEVPLLGVARAKRAIHGEDALPQAGIGCNWNWSHYRAAG